MNKLNSGFSKLPDDVFDNKAQTIIAALIGNAALPTTKENRLPVATPIQPENAALSQRLVLLNKAARRSLFACCFVSVLIAIFTTTSAFAGGKKKTTPPRQPQPTLIASVSGNAITVSDDKITRTFVITQFTEINVNGQRATVADLKPGMVVNVTIGTDPTRAGRINASGAPIDHGKKKK